MEIKDTRPATDKQLDWLKSLISQRSWASVPERWIPRMNEIAEAFAAASETETVNDVLAAKSLKIIDRTGFNVLLSYLKNAPAANRPVPVEDGMYRVNGVIYKVYHTVHGANQQVAKRLEVDANDDGVATVWFQYIGKAPLYEIKPEHRMSYDEMREFGALYGTCCICGITLTNELSIYLGIGPICGSREFGGDFKIKVKEAKLKIAKSA